MPGTGISVAILENIESGRRVNLDISTLLNLAHALHVPVTALLVPISRPDDLVDLPNLNETLAGMTAAQFDGWLSGTTTGAYTVPSADERNDLAQVRALRELHTARHELRRLEAVASLTESDPAPIRDTTASQIEATRTQIGTLETYLRTAGWGL